jgi:hypothetical protein
MPMPGSLAELLADPAARAVLRLLAAAGDLVLPQGRSPAEVAIPSEVIVRGSPPQNRLGELVAAGLVEQGESGCWLTEAGRHALVGAEAPVNGDPHAPGSAVTPEVPRWDGENRTLWLGGALVKSLPCWARSERELLDFLQQSAWAEEVSNPFLKGGRPDARRLRAAARSLNAGQGERGVEFTACRGGQRVRWGVRK